MCLAKILFQEGSMIIPLINRGAMIALTSPAMFWRWPLSHQCGDIITLLSCSSIASYYFRLHQQYVCSDHYFPCKNPSFINVIDDGPSLPAMKGVAIETPKRLSPPTLQVYTRYKLKVCRMGLYNVNLFLCYQNNERI